MKAVFNLPPVGWLGKQRVDRQYMDQVKQRTLELKRATRVKKIKKSDSTENQLCLSFPKKTPPG